MGWLACLAVDSVHIARPSDQSTGNYLAPATSQTDFVRAVPFLTTRRPVLHYRIDDHTDSWRDAGAVVLQHAPGFFPEGTDPRLRDWYVGEIAKADAEVLCGLYGTLLRHASAEALLPDITAPVLGLYPTSGLLTSSEQEDLLARGIRDLTMIHLPTSSHAVLTLYPAECAEHLLAFIARHDGDAAPNIAA